MVTGEMAKPDVFVCGRFTLALDRPLIMGVVNITPDSFSDGGDFLDAGRAIAHAQRLVEEGADILDLGGVSSRPGSAPVALDEERRRVLRNGLFWGLLLENGGRRAMPDRHRTGERGLSQAPCSRPSRPISAPIALTRRQAATY